MKPAAATLRHVRRDVALEGGARLAERVTAYRTFGTLSPTRDNVVLVLHGYTTGPAMLDDGAHAAEGAWSALVGPGRAIDTDRYFVVCPNMLGSSYGSTGPGSIDPATGRPYGVDFPAITVGDIVAAQKDLLDDLGVTRLHAAVGPSFGGYQALQWAVDHPAFVQRVVAAVSAPFNPPHLIAPDALAVQLLSEPAWNDGRPEPGAMVPWLTAMRRQVLAKYGIDAELAAALPDPDARAAEVERLARGWAEEFHAGSLIVLGRAAAAFDLRPRLAAIRAPVLMVLSRSDAGFPPSLRDEFGPAFDAAGVRWAYREIDSDKGHLASGADAALWADELRGFLDADPATVFAASAASAASAAASPASSTTPGTPGDVR